MIFLEFKLPKKTLLLWQIRAALLFCLPIAVLMFFYGFSYWFILPSGIILILGLITVFVYLPFYFKGFRIMVDRDMVEVECGVIIRVTHIMPFLRLIYTSSYSTPLGQLFSVSGLSLRAARSRLVLPEMKDDDIKELLEKIKKG